MKWILWIVVVVSQFTLLSEASYAAEKRNFYTSIRCQAMGGACSAITSDETSLIVNPSALGKIRESYLTLFDPEIELGAGSLEGFLGSKLTNPFFLASNKKSLDGNRGQHHHARLQVFPSYIAKNFGIGLFGNYLLDAEMNSAGTEINTYYRNDLALVLGFNLRFFDGRIKLGVNTKLISRIEIDDSELDATGSLDPKDIGTEGMGLSTDIGLTFTAPWTYLPTLSAVLRDVGGTTFDKATGVRLNTVDRPNSVDQDLDIAMAFFPIHSRNWRSAWTIEYKGVLTAKDEDDKAKLLHAGAEFNLADRYFFRLGYNQRYITGGFEVNSERTQWQFATYGEEIGTKTNSREDRRFAIKWALRY